MPDGEVRSTSFRWVYDDGGRAAAGRKGIQSDCVVRALAIASHRLGLFRPLTKPQVYEHVWAGLRAAARARPGTWPFMRRGVSEVAWQWWAQAHGFHKESFGGKDMMWIAAARPRTGVGIVLTGTTKRENHNGYEEIVLDQCNHVFTQVGSTFRDMSPPLREGKTVLEIWTHNTQPIPVGTSWDELPLEKTSPSQGSTQPKANTTGSER